jgi:hypothetical protein
MGDETTSPDLDAVVELHHRAGDSIMKGSYEGYAELYSRQDDVTLGNPSAPSLVGTTMSCGRCRLPHRITETARSPASSASRST